jgi:hypothetical protein
MVEIFCCYCQEIAFRDYPGIGKKSINMSKSLNTGGYHGSRVFRFGYVAHSAADIGAGCRKGDAQLVQTGAINVVDDILRRLSGKQQRRRTADAPRGPGYQHGLVFYTTEIEQRLLRIYDLALRSRN